MYCFALSIGSCGCLVSYILHKKYGLSVLSAYLRFYFLLTTWIFLDLYLGYLKVQLEPHWYHCIEKVGFFVITSCEILLMYFMPLFILHLVQHPDTSRWLSVLKRITLFFYSGLVLRAFLDAFFWVSDSVVKLFYTVMNGAFLTLILCVLVWGMQYLRQRKQEKVDAIVRAIVVLTGAFFIGFLIDLLRVGFITDLLHAIGIRRFLEQTFTFHFYVLFYTTWGVLFLRNTLSILIQDTPKQEMVQTESLFEQFKITPREREIISHISQGKTNVEIAEELFISAATVKRHIQNIYEKLEVGNRTALLNKLHMSSINPLGNVPVA